MNAVAPQGNGVDPYAAYGRQAGGVQGTFLKFDKGSYYAGKDSKVVPIGTRMVANFADFMIGWRCWKEGKLVEDRMMLLADGSQPAPRSELPDQDQELWEMQVDKKTGIAEPKDPWQFGNTLPLFDPKSNEQYIFGVQSKSGIRSLAQTVGAFGRERRAREGLLPVVELQGDSFQSDGYGRIPFPKLVIVDWVATPGAAQPELALAKPATKF